MARVAQAESAFGQRTSPYLLNVIARSVDGVGFDGDATWARDARTALAAYGSDAMYVNFTGEAGADKVRASYPPQTYAKLVEVKKRYDPTNLFRLNQNIQPTSDDQQGE
jgi:FAD/FMN-containing dehydrogenase